MVILTESGKQMFSEQEEALEKRAEELFGDLTEGVENAALCAAAQGSGNSSI